jgi:hypothetical protein
VSSKKPAPGGHTWKNFKHAYWMAHTGVFTCKEFAEHFNISVTQAWGTLELAVDAGFLEAVGGAGKKGSPTQYQFAKDAE